MGQNEIDNADYGNLTNTQTVYTIDSLNTDGATGSDETYYQCNFTTWNGMYKKVAIIKSIIDKKAFWTIGKGYKANPVTEKILKRITGFGKDTFNSIMFNAVATYTYAGDFYAEIVRDKAGRLINLKPLNPGSIRVVADNYGIIKRYEQVAQVGSQKKVIQKFKPDEIFHLCKDRIADEIHGTSTLDKMQDIIKMYSKSISNAQTLQDRNVIPIHIFKLDTDDPVKIATFKAKADKAVDKGENIYIPMGAVENDILNLKTVVDPIPWIRELEKIMIIAEGVPEEILGSSQSATDASSKIKYLAFQQMIEWNQLFLEEQLKSQLNLEISFEFPASIDPAIQQTESKNGNTTNKFGTDPTKQSK